MLLSSGCTVWGFTFANVGAHLVLLTHDLLFILLALHVSLGLDASNKTKAVVSPARVHGGRKFIVTCARGPQPYPGYA